MHIHLQTQQAWRIRDLKYLIRYHRFWIWREQPEQQQRSSGEPFVSDGCPAWSIMTTSLSKQGDQPQSPDSMLSWSSMSSPTSTAGFPSPVLRSPDPAYPVATAKKSRTHFINLDGLRDPPSTRNRDIEAQNQDINRDFTKMGW